ncbi:unnamed protein product [Rangifer tarandus platyrhynchus]|uniref:Uncharacterized protein n=1 Tax=Rangifer tarandus platyrhynchus TaxID=3082113 RepID=A0AC59YAH4_RANTA
MEGGSCLRVAGNRSASSLVQFDLQPTVLAPRRKQHGAWGSLRGVPTLSRGSWPRQVHCVQRGHGSCHVWSILGPSVLEQTEEGCCCMTTARPSSPVASAQYGRTRPRVTRSGAWERPGTLGPWDSQLDTFNWLCPSPAGATGHGGPRRLVSFHLDQVLQWPPCPPLCSWCNF